MFALGRIALLTGMFFMAFSGVAVADTFHVFLANELGETVRLFVDGQFACDMPPEGSCMAPVPDGAHVFRAERITDGSFVEAPVNNPGSSLHWAVGPNGFVEYGGQ